VRGALWLAGSIKYMDFSHKALLLETALLGVLCHGSITFSDCRALPFDQYEYLVKDVPGIIKKEMEKNDG
jgi:hypothetical protein